MIGAGKLSLREFRDDYGDDSLSRPETALEWLVIDTAQ
jgi:hypothetical protein